MRGLQNLFDRFCLMKELTKCLILTLKYWVKHAGAQSCKSWKQANKQTKSRKLSLRQMVATTGFRTYQICICKETTHLYLILWAVLLHHKWQFWLHLVSGPKMATITYCFVYFNLENKQKQQQTSNVQTNATSKWQCTNKNNNKSAMYEQKQQQIVNVQTKATKNRQCRNKCNNKPAMDKQKQQQTSNEQKKSNNKPAMYIHVQNNNKIMQFKF